MGGSVASTFRWDSSRSLVDAMRAASHQGTQGRGDEHMWGESQSLYPRPPVWDPQGHFGISVRRLPDFFRNSGFSKLSQEFCKLSPGLSKFPRNVVKFPPLFTKRVAYRELGGTTQCGLEVLLQFPVNFLQLCKVYSIYNGTTASSKEIR